MSKKLSPPKSPKRTHVVKRDFRWAVKKKVLREQQKFIRQKNRLRELRKSIEGQWVMLLFTKKMFHVLVQIGIALMNFMLIYM